MSIVNIGKFIILRLLYPWQYKRYSNAPVESGKVVFAEVRNETLSNSMNEMYLRISEDERFTATCHFLNEGVSGRLDNAKRTMAFLKDMATAEYVFLSEANNSFACFVKREETKVIQLWHGCGAFKKFGLSSAELKFGSNRAQQEKYPLYNNLDLVTVSSPEVIWAYEEAMGLKQGIVQATGISRTDVFFDEEYVEAAKARVRSEVPEIGDRKILFYAPTFRGSVTNAKAPDELNIEMMKEKLGDRYALLIKHHPFINERSEIPVICRDFAYDVTEKIDIDELICVGDMCISDYSSLIFEYALFEKPIIFFAYDIDDYNDWRGFFYDYDTLTPGPVVKITEEVIACIEKCEEGFDKSEIREFKNKFMSSCDGKATERIMETMGMN